MQASVLQLRPAVTPLHAGRRHAYRARVGELLALHRLVQGQDEAHKVAGRLCKAAG